MGKLCCQKLIELADGITTRSEKSSLVDHSDYKRRNVTSVCSLFRPASGKETPHWNTLIFINIESALRAVAVKQILLKCVGAEVRPPLWSSGQSSWLQMQGSRIRFPGTTKK
jgi:hypothetical protein